MKTTLEKWLLAVGVFLFVWFLVPELKASAAVYTVDASDYGGGSFEVNHTVSGNTHMFSVDGYEDIVMTLNDEYPYIVCHRFYTSGKVGFCISQLQPISYHTVSGGLEVDYPILDGVGGSSYYWYDFRYTHPVGLIYFDTSTGELISEYHDSLDTTKYYLGFTKISKSNPEYNNQFYYSNFDIYQSGGVMVFRKPLPTPTPTPAPTMSLQQQFQTAVMETNLEAVMNQVVGLVPLLIGFLITLISFSKGLQLLSQILRRA